MLQDLSMILALQDLCKILGKILSRSCWDLGKVVNLGTHITEAYIHVNREFKLRVIRQTSNGKRQANKNFTVSGNKE
jgi:hypothetical protein